MKQTLPLDILFCIPGIASSKGSFIAGLKIPSLKAWIAPAKSQVATLSPIRKYAYHRRLTPNLGSKQKPTA